MTRKNKGQKITRRKIQNLPLSRLLSSRSKFSEPFLKDPTRWYRVSESLTNWELRGYFYPQFNRSRLNRSPVTFKLRRLTDISYPLGEYSLLVIFFLKFHNLIVHNKCTLTYLRSPNLTSVQIKIGMISKWNHDHYYLLLLCWRTKIRKRKNRSDI